MDNDHVTERDEVADVIREMAITGMSDVLGDETPLRMAVTWALDAEEIFEHQEEVPDAVWQRSVVISTRMATMWATIAQAVGTDGRGRGITIGRLMRDED